MSRPPSRRLISIVEGDGECAALPILVERMLRHLRRELRVIVDPAYVLCAKDGERITRPYDPGRKIGVEWFVARAAREKPAGILVVVDAEDRCVKREEGQEPLGPHLLERARREAGGMPVAVVVANRMFEAWFLADFQSLRARGHLLPSASFPHWRAPEAVGGCKGWLKDALGRSYAETQDQAAFAGAVSLPLRPAMQRRSPSLWKLFREVDRLSRKP